MINEPQLPQSPLPPKQPSDLKILGLNLLIFAVYSLLCVYSGGDGGIAAFMIAGVHTLICIILAIAQRRWIWVLAGLMILVIGFATCVSNFHLDVR